MAVELPLTSPERAARYRRLGIWRDDTIWERFRAAAARVPEKTAIVEERQRLTYGELRRRVDDLAGNLLDLGVARGDVVAIQAWNCAELPLLHLALNRIGRLFMPLHDSWRHTELRHLLRKSRARAVVIPGQYRGFDHAAMLAELRDELPDLEHVFVLGGAAPGCRAFEDLLAPTRRSGSDLDAERPDPDLPASIMMSGGTTALSKISRFSSNDLLTMLDHFATSVGLREDDVAAALAPAGTGATGYIYPILTPLLHGATSTILKRWGDPADAVDWVLRHRCTYLTAIPTQVTLMVPVLEKHRPEEFEAFRFLFATGSGMPAEVARAAERLMGCIVQTNYGSTDGGVPVHTTVNDPPEKRTSTVGRVVSGCECEIRDADGKPLPAGQPGEVVWRGADKSWGYLGDDDETAATFTRDGFYKSGDVGVFDEDGYLRIVGRIKDMILRGGRNISPRTIEDLLIQHPAVVEVAVAAMPDPTLGERACAFVMLRPGARLAFEEMVAFLKEQEIAIWQLPERLEIVGDFPRGAGGKIVKKQLTEMVTKKLQAEKQSCAS